MPDLTCWVGSSGRDGPCADQGHLVTGAWDGEYDKELRKRWPGKVLFASDPSQPSRHPNYSPGQGVVPSSLRRPA